MVAAVSNPDAELIRLCKALATANANLQRAPSGTTEAEYDVLDNAWWEVIDPIINTPARSPEDIRAKASALRYVQRRLVPVCIGATVATAGEHEDLLAWSLLHDILSEEPDWS